MKKLIVILSILVTFPFAANAADGDIIVSGEWARPILIAGRPGGAFLTIKNNGADTDKLVGATSSISPRVEIHNHLMEDGVMKMRQVDGGIEIPAGGSVELKPGSYHIMMFETDNKYGPGDTIDLKLEFEKAGEIEKKVEIRARQ
ncbi:copper chaperone PCu(A)C [Pseudemcibacter aquimaris]|uniref:copper chaperone PCu(A)C n=1 Tax=Pseudemcibacter aquimaris TaxID=2857064 RepID=UPI002013609C|nr:copper chaperone PCu(A)C [Pseudemcibacter aquimaris]MCC3860341.1 copper chaperone PCu(A)C [Pseudemcibacter aquimaris]WDU57667.1 copper chaperone PCu(A)C [Pseudemcibacter aquimaris]